VLLALALVPPARTGEIALANARIEVRLDDSSGAIRQVRNLASGLDLVARPGLTPPFVLETSAGPAPWTGFTLTLDPTFPGAACDLRWTTGHPGLSVEARVEVPSGSDDARFTFRVVNGDATLGIESLEYPAIAGIERLIPAGGTDVALQPVAMGYLFRDPWTNLATGITKRLYPDAYGGACIQTSAYYREGAGGFALEVRDGSGTAKNFSFGKDPANGDIRWSVETLAWDRRPGLGLDPGYEVRIAALSMGDWEEAADRYRSWAILEPWASRGRVADRPDAEVPRWLYEQVLASTFGVSINMDQSRWFGALHDWVGGPLFHVSAFWWPGGTAASEWYGGYNDWSDGRVNVANLNAIRSRGDYWAPFLFDLHFSRDVTEWDAAAPDPVTDPVAPWQPYEMVPDPESAPWAYMCPATPQWRTFHGWRDLRLYDNFGYDANYYDIGAGLGRVRCDEVAHGHPPGSGRWMIDGYRAMLDSGRSDLHARAGRRIAAGTEMMSELYIREFDYYQARAEASVMSMLEGDGFRAGEKGGWAEKVPLFAYVYHDVGPVRLDGNLKAAARFGDIFWWLAARVVAWGGLAELNYELSALERFPGMTDRWTWYETYKSTFDVLDNSPYDSAADRGAFLGRLGRARIGFAQAYLAYGRMTRGPRLVSGPSPVSLDWHLYNTFQRATDTSSGIENGPEFFQQGNFTADPIVRSGWDDDGRALGLVFVNVLSSAAAVTIEVNPSRHGLPFLNYSLSRVEESGRQNLGVLSGTQDVSVMLPSRAPLLLEAVPSDCVALTCLYRVYRETAAASLTGTAPFATAVGHTWDDPAPSDGANRYYLVNDGSGRPGALRVERVGEAVRVNW
jgi:hypothetical protein